jgi:hypothetical protein
MASAVIDHMVSLTIFIAAMLIFIGLFSQTMQTGLTYERHKALSTSTSDLLDSMLLNPGIPETWGKTDSQIVGFGLQDPEYSQYRLSSFSAMRLAPFVQAPIYYPRTGTYYNNITAGFGSCLYTSVSEDINYSTVSRLLGINGTTGFQLTLTPTLTISATKTSDVPLTFSLNVAGTGYLLANAPVSCSLIVVKQDANPYPSIITVDKNATTDVAGSAQIAFPGVDISSQSYALLAYSNLDGLKGMSYYVHNSPSLDKSVVPLIDSFESRTIILSHSDSIGDSGNPSTSELSYNASFVILSDDYTLRQVQLDQPSTIGDLVYNGVGQDWASIAVPSNEGILVVAYKGASNQYGLVMMPWGLGSLSFPLTFGGNPAGHDWVTTDIRQVSIGSISYQAKLALWNLQGSI